MEDCIFCKIIKGDIPSTKEYEDEDLLAFNDINPSMPTHILIIPKKHIKNLSDIIDDDVNLLGKIQLAASNIAKEKGLENYKLVTNNGEKAGQSVFHIHYHLLGGFK